jgi:hypothetical protein
VPDDHCCPVHCADIEGFARDLEAKGRARATVTRRLCTIAGFYRYAVEEELLEHSPAAHVRRPPVDERRPGQSGYLTLPGEHGRMILHGFRGKGGSVEAEISPLTVPVATRSRMEAFRLPFLRGGKAGRPAWFWWAG